MLLCRFPIDAKENLSSGKAIRITVSMYRNKVDGAYRQLITEKAASGEFTAYLVAILESIVDNGKCMF